MRIAVADIMFVVNPALHTVGGETPFNLAFGKAAHRYHEMFSVIGIIVNVLAGESAHVAFRIFFIGRKILRGDNISGRRHVALPVAG